MTELDMARLNLAGVLLHWLDGDVSGDQFVSAVVRYHREGGAI